MNQILKTSTTLVLATFALAACGTPGPVRDLASRTAANVSQVSTHLKALSASTKGVASARARNVARLKATVREVRRRHTLDIALTKKAGDGGSLALKDEIVAWMTEARAAARGMTVAEFKKAPKVGSVDRVSDDIKEVMDSLESLDPKTKALVQVAKTLAALSKKDDLKARAKFLIGYVKEIRAEMDEKEKAADAAAKSAKSTAENAATTAQKAVEK